MGSKSKVEADKEIDKKYLRVFDGGDGRIVLNDMMIRHNVFSTTYSDAEDSRAHAFREGKRAVVMDIMNLINMSEDEFNKRHQEVIDEEVNILEFSNPETEQ